MNGENSTEPGAHDVEFVGVQTIKITGVGDGLVGKKSLFTMYTTKKFPNDYVPTVFENYTANINVDGQEYNLAIWDTAGQEDYDRLRILSYPNTNCFLTCFAVNSRDAFENIASKWVPEVRHHGPTTPIVLVGLKTDLRKPNDPDFVSAAEGMKMMSKIGAARYVECSALKNEGLQEVFIEAVRAAVEKSASRVNKCVLV